ncbi:hypothetical protein CGC20_29175 [Leishmania donovani]|uniref:EF-hand domain-containing protein n=1 Tax=Leishmania donovani TaxID=5661 RepID=A0A504X1Z5_LEIDO|nr:hypothetical protein CGC20_29175 [Leishmania donovani]
MSAVASDDSAGHVVDPVQHTHRYIQEHKLNELFGICCNLIREEKVSSSLFTERDLETMFEMIDVTAQRWITVAQLRNTCRNLATASSAGTGSTGGGGLTAEQEAAIAGAGDAAGRVTMENFKGVLSSLLLTKNKWS